MVLISYFLFLCAISLQVFLCTYHKPHLGGSWLLLLVAHTKFVTKLLDHYPDAPILNCCFLAILFLLFFLHFDFDLVFCYFLYLHWFFDFCIWYFMKFALLGNHKKVWLATWPNFPYIYFFFHLQSVLRDHLLIYSGYTASCYHLCIRTHEDTTVMTVRLQGAASIIFTCMSISKLLSFQYHKKNSSWLPMDSMFSSCPILSHNIETVFYFCQIL